MRTWLSLPLRNHQRWRAPDGEHINVDALDVCMLARPIDRPTPPKQRRFHNRPTFPLPSAHVRARGVPCRRPAEERCGSSDDHLRHDTFLGRSTFTRSKARPKPRERLVLDSSASVQCSPMTTMEMTSSA